jgi:hypothetical protein
MTTPNPITREMAEEIAKESGFIIFSMARFQDALNLAVIRAIGDWHDSDCSNNQPAYPNEECDCTYEIEYELWQGDAMVASSNDKKEIEHYAAVYSQDGPVVIYEVFIQRRLYALANTE